MTTETPLSGNAPGMPHAAAPEKMADQDTHQAQKPRRDPILLACKLRDLLRSEQPDMAQAHDMACDLVGRLVMTVPTSGRIEARLMERSELDAASREATRLAWLAGGLDTLRWSLPGFDHDTATEQQIRAYDALIELITVVIERTHALSERLDQLHMASR